MKQIFTDRNLTHCDLVRCALEASGIPAVLRNEHACHTVGAGLGSALGVAWPEVWILDDGDAEDAAACLRQSGFSLRKARLACGAGGDVNCRTYQASACGRVTGGRCG